MTSTAKLRQDGIIFNSISGAQTESTIRTNLRLLLKLAKKISHQKKPVLCLININGITSQDSASRKAADQSLRELDYDKVAVFGAPLYLKYVAILVIKGSGNSDKVKYFDTEKEAVEWLKS